MSHPHRIPARRAAVSSRGARVVRGAALVALLAALLGIAAPASAHPLGNFTTNRYTGILVATDQVTLDHVVDLAEIPTSQLGERLDDLDRLGAQECDRAADELGLRVDGSRVGLTVTSSDARTREGEGGLPTTRVSCRLRGEIAVADGTEVVVVDEAVPGQVGWREMTAVGDRTTLTSASVPDTSLSARLTDYPRDLLSSPLSTTRAELVVSPGGPPGTLPGEAGAASEPSGNALLRQATALMGEGGLTAGVLAVLLALVLGATHALAPGHGKTVMAFYLTQQGRASLTSAAKVGAAVTLAHTGSVVVLGLAISLSTTFVPARVFPWLSLATGVLILALGVTLVRRARAGGHVHGPGGHTHGPGGHTHGPGGHTHGPGGHTHGPSDHDHHHEHWHDHHDEHDHEHHQHALAHHDHGHHEHPHAHAHGTSPLDEGAGGRVTVLSPESGSRASAAPEPRVRADRWSLAVMGLVGGLVPSPSALVLLLGAVALGQTWFGLLLVLAFGLGMAATLAGVGLLATDLVSRVERIASRSSVVTRPLRAVIGYGAALGVCAVGIGVVVRAVLSLG